MPTMYGYDFSQTDLLRHVGCMNQIAGIREYVYSSGRADGVRAIEVNTGALQYELLPSRCLDVAAASYRGIPFAYLSKSWLRHPAYYAGHDFAGNFFGGALTTCGLHNIGGPRSYGGREHGLHGEMANVPADMVSVREEWDGDDCVYSVSGHMRHSRFYGEDLLLRRTVTSRLGGASLAITDEVENQDFTPSPCLLLYHINFGFPFLSEDTRLMTSPAEKIVPRNAHAESVMDKHASFGGPEDNGVEACFFHYLKPGKDGLATACLFNPKLGGQGMGVYVRYDPATLPFLVQWKMLRSREYVCGLEPASALLDERNEETMKALSLDPMETRRFRVEIGVREGEAACRAMCEG